MAEILEQLKKEQERQRQRLQEYRQQKPHSDVNRGFGDGRQLPSEAWSVMHEKFVDKDPENSLRLKILTGQATAPISTPEKRQYPS